jgi:hypothetical protein
MIDRVTQVIVPGQNRGPVATDVESKLSDAAS